MRDDMIMKTPASWHRDLYREAAPTGNGVIGLLVYGGIQQETLAINHSKLWEIRQNADLPDIHETLQQTRDGIDRGDYWHANWYSTNALKEAGYHAELGNPVPLCDLRLELKDRKPFQHYRRIVHMDSGEVSVSWREGEASFLRNAFVSRVNDLVFYEIHATQASLDLALWMDLHETYESDTTQKRALLEPHLQCHAKGNIFGFYARHEDETYYGGIGAVQTDGKLEATVDGRVMIEGATRIMVVIQPFIGRSLAQVTESADLLDEELYAYEIQKDKHRIIHEKLYRSADIKLSAKMDSSNEELLLEAYEDKMPPELLEKQWRFGRYLMICGTREGALPFPLYGIWHGRYEMPWPHNMANENVQMIYWHVLAGGMADSLKVLLHYYTGRMDYYRECARKIFGLPGIYLPAGTTPENSMPNQIVPVIMNWIGCAGWLAQHFYQYYQYTGDEATLEQEILPFMMEAAEFYVHYLVKEEDGSYKIYPSVSPENTPGNLIPVEEPDLAHPCPSVVNATMDIAIIKELLTNLLEIWEQKGGQEENCILWKDIILHLPPYESTADGDIREWQFDGLEQRYNHRHLSHIYPVFPGNEVVKGRDSEELLASFELAVNKRILGAQTGWSLAHMACIYARFGRSEQAMESLDTLSKSCLLPNLFTLHNDWRGMGLTLGRGPFAPVQLDAAMGCVQAVQEMLLYAGKDVLKLLPALPKRLAVGEVKCLHFMTGSVDMRWDAENGKFEARISAERPTSIQLILPGFVKRCHYTAEGKKRTFASGEVLAIPLGETLLLQSKTLF